MHYKVFTKSYTIQNILCTLTKKSIHRHKQGRKQRRINY